jgi:hypothetical protein
MGKFVYRKPKLYFFPYGIPHREIRPEHPAKAKINNAQCKIWLLDETLRNHSRNIKPFAHLQK